MNGRVIKFEGPVHAQADRLLPWYVNGTLDPDERLQVEQHLVECAQCRREVSWLRELQGEFAERARSEDMATATRRLPHRLGKRHAAPPVPRWRSREKRLAWLVAVQAAVLLGLGIALFQQPHGVYRTLGAPKANRTSLLVVVFDPATREAQLRQLLHDSGARIVDGPTESGGYVLSVPVGREQLVRQTLHGSPQVILAEPLDGGGRP